MYIYIMCTVFEHYLYRNINGFLNTGEGGRIYLGVLDNGVVAGLHLSEEQVISLVQRQLYVMQEFHVSTVHAITNKHVMVKLKGRFPTGS